MGRWFVYHLELRGGETIHHYLAPLTCGLGGGALEPRWGAVPDFLPQDDVTAVGIFC
jgi:hypothetical protein